MSEAEVPEGKSAKRRPRRLRWAGRLLVRLLIIALIGALVTGLLGWYLFSNLTGVVNTVLRDAAAPHSLEVGEVAWIEAGLVKVRGARFRGEQGTEDLLQLGELELSFDPATLVRSRRFNRIRLIEPQLRVDGESLASLGAGEGVENGRGAAASKPPPDLTFLGRIADRVSVEGGQAEVALPGLPALRFEFSLDTEGLDFGAERLSLDRLEIRKGEAEFLEWETEGVAWPVGSLTFEADLQDLGYAFGVGFDSPARQRIRLMGIELGSGQESAQRALEVDRVEVEFQLDALLERRDLASLEIDRPQVRLTEATLARWAGLLSSGGRPNEDSSAVGKAAQSERVGSSEPAPDGKPWSMAHLAVREGRVEIDHPSLGGRSWLGEANFSLETLPDAREDRRKLVLEEVRLEDREAWGLPLEAVSGGENLKGRVEVSRVAVEASLTQLQEDFALEGVQVEDAFVALSSLDTEGEAGPRIEVRGDLNLGKVSSLEGGVRLETLDWEGSGLTVSALEWDGKPLPGMDLALQVALRKLEIGAGGWRSETEQRVRLGEVVMRGPGAEVPALFTLEEAEVVLIPDRLREARRFERVAIEAPIVQVNPKTLAGWGEAWIGGVGKSMAEGGSGIEPAAVADPAEAPMLEQASDSVVLPWHVEDLALNRGQFSVRLDQVGGRKLWGEGTLDLRNRREQDRPTELEASFRELRLKDPEAWGLGSAALTQGVGNHEIVGIREVKLVADSVELQQERFVRSLEIDGAVARVGEGMKTLIAGEEAGKKPANSQDVSVLPESETPNQAPPPEADAGATPERSPRKPGATNQGEGDPVQESSSAEGGSTDGGEGVASESAPGGWRIGAVRVHDSRVRIDSLIEGIRGLEFEVSTELEDVPLTKDGLLSRESIQKVEISRIEIKDPYNGFITVAYLPTIFIEFSLAGLVNREIETIDLIGPSLYVGEGLFWWIDYQRKHRAVNEGVGVGLEGEGAPVAAKKKQGDWKIHQINAHFGKMIIAPAGYPIGIVPFPFSASTDLREGRIALSLDIPKEQYIYSIPDHKVDLYGLSGNVEFNVPIQQEDNNLVQTFELDRVVWKQFEAEGLYVTVTYDQQGVYGQFGGGAYGGYVNGAFNVYLKDIGRWDGWVAATEFDTQAFSKVLAPESFFMTGVLSGKLVSEGRKLELGKTSGAFETLSPGFIDITRLDEIIENLPDDWTVLQSSLTRLALNGLKRFDYNQGHGSLYLQGREGRAQLSLEGPSGERVVNLNVHDLRDGSPAATPTTDSTATSVTATDAPTP